MDITSWLVSADDFCCNLSTDLSQVDCRNLLVTGLLQIVSTTCNKSANDELKQSGKIDNLQQVEKALYFWARDCQIADIR